MGDGRAAEMISRRLRASARALWSRTSIGDWLARSTAEYADLQHRCPRHGYCSDNSTIATDGSSSSPPPTT